MSAALIGHLPSAQLLEAYPATEPSQSPSSVLDSEVSQTTTSSGAATKLIRKDEDRRPLSSLIALGTLTLGIVLQDSEKVYLGSHNWEELDVSPAHRTALRNSLDNDLLTLLDSGVIRATVPVQDVTDNSTRHDFTTIRIYALPTNLHAKASRSVRSHLENIIQRLDVSSQSWSASPSEDRLVNETGQTESIEKFNPWATPRDESLFFLFNTLSSPKPNPECIEEQTSQLAAQRILDLDGSLVGLRSRLYPFQARSAALMLQKETAHELQLDPRLEARIGPDGKEFYYDPRGLSFFKYPKHYSSYKGGILAESMGLGKTLICLAVVLATRGHMPKIPPHYQDPIPVREKTASLKSMVSNSIVRHSLPWKAIVRDLEEQEDLTLSTCTNELEKIVPEYSLVDEPVRFNRKTTIQPPRRLRMCGGTILVVPRNLIQQWLSEIKKHLYDDALSVLVLDDARKQTPPVEELVNYDLVVFTKPRFEAEAKDGQDVQGRRVGQGKELSCQCSYIGSTRMRDCVCVTTDRVYTSPLKSLHWLRIIVDEGHGFANANTNAAVVAEKIVQAERRWIVSGTPAKDLVGVEIDLATGEKAELAADAKNQSKELELRQNFNRAEDTAGATKSLGTLVNHFLQVSPWHSSRQEEKAEWEDYIYMHEDFKKRTYSAFSSCLKNTLQALVIKTRPEDVDKDIRLPPLRHKVVYLEPSFYDKMTSNMFIQVIRANAVTSERTDVDYLFHKSSQKPRHDLIRNLQQSNFAWTGFTEKDVRSTIATSVKYLLNPDAKCTEEDRDSLLESVALAESTLRAPGWGALSRSQEIGIFLEQFPAAASQAWSLGNIGHPIMIGLTQLLEAQKFVNGLIDQGSPVKGLKDLGQRVMRQTLMEANGDPERSLPAQSTSSKAGVPESCFRGQMITRFGRARGTRSAVTTRNQNSKSKKSTSKAKPTSIANSSLMVVSPTVSRKRNMPEAGSTSSSSGSPTTATARSKRVRFDNVEGEKEDPTTPLTVSQDSLVPPIEQSSGTEVHQPQSDNASLQETSSLGLADEEDYTPDWQNTRIIGTTSAKLSYLIEKIMQHYKDEKILIFYDGENAAYYLAQFLELMHIKHLIYAATLDNARRSKYVNVFNEDESVRVFLIDVRCGALGLNLNAASLVLVINPINRPYIEAQAIKRAHRIGQTRPVHVETLVLKGSVEEAVFKRANAMTKKEHLDTKILEDDDQIKRIIQDAKVIAVTSEEAFGTAQMAPLQSSQTVFYRSDRADTFIVGVDREARAKPKSKKKAAARTGQVMT